MDGLMYSATGKRTRAESQYGETNDRNKKPNFSSTSSGTRRGREPALPGADSTVYRILCPGTLIGSVIGKGGRVINSLRKETRSIIQVADGIPGADREQVISIYSSPVNDNGNAEATHVCPAQDALLKLHSVIVAGILDHADNPEKKQVINARLLVPTSQIGSLIGKGGINIQKMRKDSGAQIQILPKEQLSASTAFIMTSVDELVQISGDATAVNKALSTVSTFLHEHPPKEKILNWNNNNNNNVLAVHANQRSLLPQPNYLPEGNGNSVFASPIQVGFGSHMAGLGLGGYGSGAGSAWPLNNYSRPDYLPIIVPDCNKGPSEEFTIRILCPNNKIGGVIGKGGNIIESMRKETRASIKVEDAATTEGDPDQERVIVVSTTEFAHDRVSPTLEAILQLQGKSSSGKENLAGAGIVICTRLLVPSRHIGCLLGKGGNIINEMRKKTGADIRVFPKEDRPKYASEKELELVQISGEDGVTRDALIQVVTRLRERVFKDVAYISGRNL